MKLNSKNTFLAITIMAIAITACQKQAVKESTTGTLALPGTKANLGWVLEDSCAFITTSLTNTTGVAPYYTYTDWTPSTWTMPGTGTVTPLVLKFEGQYVSFVRPDTLAFKGWYVGVVDSSIICGAYENWATTTNIAVKNASPNYGTDPAGTPNGKYNVVGAQGSLAIPGYTYNFGTGTGSGYYSYVNRVPTTNKTIVIWRIEDATDPTANTDPASAEEAYVIKIQSFVASGGTSTVNFKYAQVK